MPDLIEVAKRDGLKLMPMQQAMLLNVLLKNVIIFKGKCGYYNGEPVRIELKLNVVPYRSKPYPIALKNWEVLEHELD